MVSVSALWQARGDQKPRSRVVQKKRWTPSHIPSLVETGQGVVDWSAYPGWDDSDELCPLLSPRALLANKTGER